MAQTLVSLLVHLVFSTKNREEIIRPETEADLYPYMCGIVAKYESPCLAINGMPDHVHMLISMSKNIALADLLEELKKDSSKWIKTQGSFYKHFHWQGGYAGFSVSRSRVEAVKRYIATQKEHHKKVSFQDELRGLLKKHNVEYDERYIWI